MLVLDLVYCTSSGNNKIDMGEQAHLDPYNTFGSSSLLQRACTTSSVEDAGEISLMAPGMPRRLRTRWARALSSCLIIEQDTVK